MNYYFNIFVKMMILITGGLLFSSYLMTFENSRTSGGSFQNRINIIDESTRIETRFGTETIKKVSYFLLSIFITSLFLLKTSFFI